MFKNDLCTFRSRKLLCEKLEEFEQKYQHYLDLQDNLKPITEDPLYKVTSPKFLSQNQKDEWLDNQDIFYPFKALFETFWPLFKDKLVLPDVKRKIWFSYINWIEEIIKINNKDDKLKIQIECTNKNASIGEENV